MRIISYRRLREYSESHADCCEALDNWFKVASKARWSNLIEVQATFPSAESVSNFTVFNIKGNKYRLIVSIDYQHQLIYIKYVLIKYVLIHSEYDKEKWKNDRYF